MLPNMNIFQADNDKHDPEFVPNTAATDSVKATRAATRARQKAELAKVEKEEPEQDRARNIGL